MAAGNSVAERTIGRPFPKGVSGNPSGVPKKLRKLRRALEKHDTRMVARLIELAECTDDKVAVSAVGLWFKYRCPVPTDKAGAAALKATEASDLPAGVRERILELVK